MKNILTPPYSYLIFGLLLVLLLLIRLISKKRVNSSLSGKYIKKLNYLTPSELEAYQTIKNILPQGFVLFPQVNLDKIFDIENSDNSYASRNKIDRKSVDFVVFEDQNLRPVFAIELDDHSHQKFDRQQRDFIVNQLFIDTNSRLLRINLTDIRNPEQLKQKIVEEYIAM